MIAGKKKLKQTLPHFVSLFFFQRWMLYIQSILKGAMRIASLLRDGNPVLVHCSDGWDRVNDMFCNAFCAH